MTSFEGFSYADAAASAVAVRISATADGDLAGVELQSIFVVCCVLAMLSGFVHMV